MRQNNHIINRHSYQDSSSFKIRQPMNQQCYQARQNLPQRYNTSKDHQQRVGSKDHKLSSVSSFYQKPQRLHTYNCQRQEHSRELSYNSRGSNATRNSMKMSDYIALQAKNLLNNKDKFKYQGHSKYDKQYRPQGKFRAQELSRHDRQYNKPEIAHHNSKHQVSYDNHYVKYEGHYRQPLTQQSHMRSSSMHCYPSNFKVARGNQEKSFGYLNGKQMTSQPTEIPSFGIDCRTTVSGHNNNAYDQKSYSLSKYPSTSYKLQEPSVSQRRHTINSEIDERIERLRTSSTSFQHKERLSQIKKIDQHKLQNMDKINIKIKNILTTLENQEDYHKKKFGEKNNGGRVKTESCAFYDHKQLQQQQQQEQSLLSKYTKPHNTSQSRFSRFDLSRNNDTFNNSYSNLMYEDFIQDKEHNKTALGKYCENNASSYYYYEDDEAMIKSSESPFKSSPDRSFKKHSVDNKRDGSRSMSKHSKSSFDVAVSKPVGNDSTKPSRLMKQHQNLSNYSQHSQSKYAKNTGHMLTNIPQCETQIIQSKAYQYENNHSKGFAQPYHTFDNKKSSLMTKDFKTQSSYKEFYAHTNNVKKSQIQQKPTKHTESYMPGMNNNGLNAKETETQTFMNTKNLKEELQKKYMIENANKKSNLIYFKMEEKEKYIKSSGKQPFLSTGQNFRDHDDAIDEITQFNHNHKEEIIRNDEKNRQQKQREQHNFKNPAYLSAYNERNHSHQMTFDNKKKDFMYSDSIKETPRIDSQKHIFTRKSCLESVRNNKFKTQEGEKEDKLDEKFKQYQRKLEKYQKGMSASKILQSHRSQNRSLNTKRDRSHSIQNSQDKYSNQSKCFRNNSNFKPTNEARNFERINQATTSQQNMQKLLEEIRRQRQQKEMIQREENCKAKKYQPQRKISDTKSQNHFKGNQVQKYCKLVSTPPNYSKHQSHRFPKQNHQKFIQNLRRDREEAAQLSQRKSRINNNGISPQNERIMGSNNQRSQSNNSKLSSNTIVKGKNIDEEITKIQRKMQEYNQMKKELNLDSKLNTQRTQNQLPQVKEFQYPKDTRKDEFELKEQKRQKWNRVEERTSYSESKPRNMNFSSDKKSSDLLKLVTQENTFVRVKNSIVKEHKTNQIKNYLDDEIEKESNSSKSPRGKKEITGKTGYLSSKENMMPPTTTTIDSPKYPGSKKVVVGLAQNLILNSLNDHNNIEHTQNATKTDIKTPKLLKNLKNKLNQKCIIKKKAQKRGFRSQFINDLHEDNQVIKSAKKIQPCQLAQNDEISGTSRYSPENKQLLMNILGMIENQILMDEKLRNEKKMFNVLAKSDKWTILMSEYIRQNPGQKNVLLSQIVDIFTLSDEESNPFFSTRGVDFSLEEMVRTYGQCKDNWKNVINQISIIPYDQLTSCGLNAKNLDIQRKGFIEADDLTRFINMELNKYYRKRDLWLIWERIAVSNGLQKPSNSEYRLSFEQFMNGLGLAN